MRRLLPLVLLAGCGTIEEHSVRGSLDGRHYILHIPPNFRRPATLVLAFHGGGGTAQGMERFSKFSELSDRHGFIVAYPDGLERRWDNDRDVPFVAALIDKLKRDYAVDKVFATGVSNGGIFSHHLAATLADRIDGIAPVIGGMKEGTAAYFAPSRPVPVLIIQGTDDPIVPYQGGEILTTGTRLVSTDRAVELWTRNNRCGDPGSEELPDSDPADGCRATRTTWPGDAPVVLVRVEGGGHTWPGGSQYLSPLFIGVVCRDFAATEMIWEFFAGLR